MEWCETITSSVSLRLPPSPEGKDITLSFGEGGPAKPVGEVNKCNLKASPLGEVVFVARPE